MHNKVSIIIPCFNDGRYLREALSSANSQTYTNIEIIVVDDHSTDSNTIHILSEIKKEGFRVLETPHGKKGLPAARNAGIAEASGMYILPLDADDKIDPTYVAKCVKILSNRPDVGICYCKARMFGLKHGHWTLPPYTWETMLIRNVIFASALFKKADWEQIHGYDESLVRGSEDYAFWLHILALGREVVQIEEELFSYRIKPNSLLSLMASEKQNKLIADDVFRSCEQIFRDNTYTLYSSLQRMQKEQSKLSCLLSWKLIQPIFQIEWTVRQLVKKFLGRS